MPQEVSISWGVCFFEENIAGSLYQYLMLIKQKKHHMKI